jgi:fibronectin type 3 domain-containing protein
VAVSRAIGSVLTALAVLAAVGVTGAPSAQASAWAVALQSGSAAQAQAQPVPDPPSTVTATCTSTVGNTIVVSWSAVAHAASYSIFQSTSVNGTYTLGKTATTSPSTTNALVLGTFFFKVTATVGANWVSARSVASNSRTVAAISCL